MFKIGEFSKLSQVPVKTLRYYDEIDLLKPAKVDDFTGYRYYSAEQLFQLNRILALKDLGLSLAQIGHILVTSAVIHVLASMVRRRAGRTLALGIALGVAILIPFTIAQTSWFNAHPEMLEMLFSGNWSFPGQ